MEPCLFSSPRLMDCFVSVIIATFAALVVVLVAVAPQRAPSRMALDPEVSHW